MSGFARSAVVRQPGGVTRRLVLASASASRLRVLRDAGFAPDVIVSGVDEEGVSGPPDKVARLLAERKANAVAAELDGDALVLGGDSVLDVDGEARGKPDSLAQARSWWKSVAGRSAELRSGLCVIDVSTGRQASSVASSTVHYGRPSPSEMDAYLATGEPLVAAGGFTIEGYAAPFIERIEGDPSTVLGLSLPLLRRLLADLGVEIVDLWSRV